MPNTYEVGDEIVDCYVEPMMFRSPFSMINI